MIFRQIESDDRQSDQRKNRSHRVEISGSLQTYHWSCVFRQAVDQSQPSQTGMGIALQAIFSRQAARCGGSVGQKRKTRAMGIADRACAALAIPQVKKREPQALASKPG